MRLYYTGNETGIVDISFNNGYSWYRTDLDSLKNGLYLEDRNQNFSEIVIKSKSAVLKNLDILQKIKLVENKEEFRFVKVMPTHPIDKQTVLYVGETNDNYKKNHMYQYSLDTGIWNDITNTVDTVLTGNNLIATSVDGLIDALKTYAISNGLGTCFYLETTPSVNHEYLNNISPVSSKGYVLLAYSKNNDTETVSCTYHSASDENSYSDEWSYVDGQWKQKFFNNLLVNNVYDVNGGNSAPVTFKTKLKAEKEIETNQIKANQIKTTEISGENNSTISCKTKLKAEKGIIIPVGRPENLENGMIWLE
jgi:hypothetical protein